MSLGVALADCLRSYDELDIKYVAIKRIARPDATFMFQFPMAETRIVVVIRTGNSWYYA